MPNLDFQYQGKLDGLCGHYAIVNALTECGVPKNWEHQERIFLFALDRVPSAYKGMYFPKMRSILGDMKKTRVQAMPKWPESLSVEYPLASKRFEGAKTGDMYKNILKKLLSRATARCAILQVQRRSDGWEKHWIVVKKNGNRLQFIDSVAQKDSVDIRDKNWGSLRVGYQTNHQSSESAWHWIYPRQVALFCQEH
jgi:hypothetical protein